MRYLLSTNINARHPINISSGDQKSYSVKLNNIVDNVLVIAIDDGGFHHFIKKGVNDKGLKYGPYTKNSAINLYTFLKPVFQEKKVIDNIHQFQFVVGIGDGTGKDFEGTMAAEMHINFLPDSGTVTPNGSYSLDDFPETVIKNDHAKDWLLTLESSHFGDIPKTHKRCQIKILKDKSNKEMLEQSVEIHILNNNNHLTHLISTDTANEITIDHLSNGFQMLCLVAGKINRSGKSDTATFAIGDPKTDAKITVTEDDV